VQLVHFRIIWKSIHFEAQKKLHIVLLFFGNHSIVSPTSICAASINSKIKKIELFFALILLKTLMIMYLNLLEEINKSSDSDRKIFYKLIYMV
tara:strand:+ start:215 stop:493 length:279 start_codon:yes stop_codon:yes gene_type:complete